MIEPTPNPAYLCIDRAYVLARIAPYLSSITAALPPRTTIVTTVCLWWLFASSLRSLQIDVVLQHLPLAVAALKSLVICENIFRTFKAIVVVTFVQLIGANFTLIELFIAGMCRFYQHSQRLEPSLSTQCTSSRLRSRLHTPRTRPSWTRRSASCTPSSTPSCNDIPCFCIARVSHLTQGPIRPEAEEAVIRMNSADVAIFSHHQTSVGAWTRSARSTRTPAVHRRRHKHETHRISRLTRFCSRTPVSSSCRRC